MEQTPILVGCIYDSSGMRTWCIEAAEALAAAGKRVCLLHADSVSPPTVSDTVELMPIESRHVLPARESGRLRYEISRLSRKPMACVAEACRRLASRGLPPDVIYLNDSRFVDPTIAIPQFVVAWAYPTSFLGYMRKLPIHHGNLASINGVRAVLDHVGIYRRDWFAYRHATGVMSVTKQLDTELRANHVKSTLVYPGIRIDALKARQPSDVKRLVIMAADLDVPRKRVLWMLRALHDLPVPARIVLVGAASSQTIDAAKSTGLQVDVTGPLEREDALSAMWSGDVLLFGSILDDWGYVLVEALSCGLVVVAPDLSPYDESVGPAGFLYSPHTETSFREATLQACSREALPLEAREQWLEKFSRRVFADSLLSVAAGCGKNV